MPNSIMSKKLQLKKKTRQKLNMDVVPVFTRTFVHDGVNFAYVTVDFQLSRPDGPVNILENVLIFYLHLQLDFHPSKLNLG